jgi:hypothetical protein
MNLRDVFDELLDVDSFDYDLHFHSKLEVDWTIILAFKNRFGNLGCFEGFSAIVCQIPFPLQPDSL